MAIREARFNGPRGQGGGGRLVQQRGRLRFLDVAKLAFAAAASRKPIKQVLSFRC